MLERFRAVTGDRRKVLAGMAEDDWNAVTPTPAGMDSYGRFMRVRVFDCWMHEQDIRMALQRPSSDDELGGPAARLSLDEVEATIGFVVGKLAKAPDGSRVQFDLTGPLARSIRVSVDDRAQLVEDFGGQEPTVTPAGRAAVHQAGRRPGNVPGARPGRRIGGDKDVGEIVDHLNYVI